MIKEKFYGENIDELFSFFKVNVKGILHIGAHKCEELETYLKYVNTDKILWVEAIESLIKQNLEKNPDLKNGLINGTRSSVTNLVQLKILQKHFPKSNQC